MNSNAEKKISIALCTYNGERFLQEQLESIVAQTICPHELVICDDLSSDSTREILKAFVATAAFPVKLHFNLQNLGYIKNFEKAISLCIGDVITLCDQDDRWRADKLEILQKAFSDPEVGMAFSNATLIDEKGKPTGKLLWDSVHFTSDLQQSFQQGDAYLTLYKRTLVTGCAMAFRSKYWPMIRPIPSDTFLSHDGWIALLISFLAEVVIIPDCLIEYRIHRRQSLGIWDPNTHGDPTKIKNKFIEVGKGLKNSKYQCHLDHLKAFRERTDLLKHNIAPHKYASIESQSIALHEVHLNARLHLPATRFARCGAIIKELASFRYHRFSNGFISAISDMLR